MSCHGHACPRDQRRRWCFGQLYASRVLPAEGSGSDTEAACTRRSLCRHDLPEPCIAVACEALRSGRSIRNGSLHTCRDLAAPHQRSLPRPASQRSISSPSSLSRSPVRSYARLVSADSILPRKRLIVRVCPRQSLFRCVHECNGAAPPVLRRRSGSLDEKTLRPVLVFAVAGRIRAGCKTASRIARNGDGYATGERASSRSMRGRHAGNADVPQSGCTYKDSG